MLAEENSGCVWGVSLTLPAKRNALSSKDKEKARNEIFLLKELVSCLFNYLNLRNAFSSSCSNYSEIVTHL